jgi:two-component system response regulator FlrC
MSSDPKPLILIVHDDPQVTSELVGLLTRAKYQVRAATDQALVRKHLNRERPSLVLVGQSDEKGIERLIQIHQQTLDAPVIFLGKQAAVEHAVMAMRAGAADFLAYPSNSEFILETIQRHLNMRDDDAFIAMAEVSKNLLALARKVAAKDATVLLTGESGTGKEVLARYIHQHSKRRNAPFVAINCAAIPENMLEAMLFGHEKGAFTGASESRPGKFAQANGGTLLLDEITEMDLGLQAKLLRVLQEREVEPLGAAHAIPLDVRVIATTNRDLQGEVDEGRFRMDLYYRINVFPLHLLPLRERREDILPITEHLLRRHAEGSVSINSQAMCKLVDYEWPGNVRELENVLQRALILAENPDLSTEDVQFVVPAQGSAREESVEKQNLERQVKHRESDVILDALKANQGSRKHTAEQLGISPRTLRYKIARMRDEGISIPG